MLSEQHKQSLLQGQVSTDQYVSKASKFSKIGLILPISLLLFLFKLPPLNLPRIRNGPPLKALGLCGSATNNGSAEGFSGQDSRHHIPAFLGLGLVFNGS